MSYLSVLVVTSCFGHPQPLATERILRLRSDPVLGARRCEESVIKPQTTDINSADIGTQSGQERKSWEEPRVRETSLFTASYRTHALTVG